MRSAPVLREACLELDLHREVRKCLQTTLVRDAFMCFGVGHLGFRFRSRFGTNSRTFSDGTNCLGSFGCRPRCTARHCGYWRCITVGPLFLARGHGGIASDRDDGGLVQREAANAQGEIWRASKAVAKSKRSAAEIARRAAAQLMQRARVTSA